ncbi:MAG TPA: ankyrin repeat domain-containing protein [Candidatus Acidoferrales bacterium]|nr:ankyrin repeat domain-containing protein [Candidatus Acidoferrales bacterium]
MGLVALLFALMGLPEGFWERVFINRMAASSRAPDLLVYAAYRGDLSAVKAFITHGVPTNATDHSDWRTSLHAAAIAGDLPTLQYLISTGADINALDRSGDSPLELATERGHEGAAKFLTEHGAKMIRGDEAQHQKAIHDKVLEDIEELKRAAAADKRLQEDLKRAEGKKENQRK